MSEFGDVRSLTRTIKSKYKERIVQGRLLKQFTCKDPKQYSYFHVALLKDSVRCTAKVHRLVALCFCDNPNNYDTVNHKDNDRYNNHYTNLEWTTVIGNNNHRHEQGRSGGAKGSLNGRSKLSDDVEEIRRLLNEGKTQQYIADLYNVNQSIISKIKLNKSYKKAL